MAKTREGLAKCRRDHEASQTMAWILVYFITLAYQLGLYSAGSTPYPDHVTHFWALRFKQVSTVHKRKIGGHLMVGNVDPISVPSQRDQGSYRTWKSPMIGTLSDHSKGRMWGPRKTYLDSQTASWIGASILSHLLTGVELSWCGMSFYIYICVAFIAWKIKLFQPIV